MLHTAYGLHVAIFACMLAGMTCAQVSSAAESAVNAAPVILLTQTPKNPADFCNRLKNAAGIRALVLRKSGLADAVGLQGGRVLVTDRMEFTRTEERILDRFVRAGGVLVGVGRFGGSGEGRADLTTLAGCRTGPLTGIMKFRVLTWNPLFRGITVGRWFEYPVKTSTASILRVTDQGVPLAEACCRPAGGLRNPGDFRYSYWGSRYNAGYYAFAVVRLVGRGMVVRIAENLFLQQPEGLFLVLWKNLLRPDTYELLRGRLPRISDPLITYGASSLIPNPDFEEVCLSRVARAPGSNRVAGEILMPAMWYFNSWGGTYSASLVRMNSAYGEHVLLVRSLHKQPLTGGACWNLRHDQSRLVPGGRYRASIMVAGEDIDKASFGIDLMCRDNTRVKHCRELPGGTFDWQGVGLEFSVPFFAVGGRRLRRGFTAWICMQGRGRLQADHFILEKIVVDSTISTVSGGD